MMLRDHVKRQMQAASTPLAVLPNHHHASHPLIAELPAAS